MTAGWGSLLGLGDLRDHGFGRQHEAGDRGCVQQGSAGDLGRVDDAGLDQVLVLVGAGVVAEVGVLVLQDLADDNRAFFAGVADDLAQRLLDGATDDVCTDLLVTSRVLTSSSTSLAARMRATPPPGTMPSSTAARVACMASSTRAFFSFISVSVAAPTLMTATPPTSLARRSWSFSRS